MTTRTTSLAPDLAAARYLNTALGRQIDTLRNVLVVLCLAADRAVGDVHDDGALRKAVTRARAVLSLDDAQPATTPDGRADG